jgi:hypothetical protein
MSEVRETRRERFRWLAEALLAFAASRALLYLFALAAPLFASSIGVDGPGGLAAHPTWAALAHGEIAGYARVARQGYLTVADAPFSPLISLWGGVFGKALGSVEAALLLTSLVLCALGFVAAYRVFERLRGVGAARSGVALLAAFPFAYHLSDGGALAALFAFSSWGVLLALERRPVACVVVFALGTLAHPLCLAVSLASWSWAAADRGRTEELRRPGWAGLAAVAIPGLLLLAWLLYLRSRLPTQGAGLLSALLGGGTALRPEARALLVGLGALLGVGGLLLARRRGARMLALAGGLELGAIALVASPSSVHALAALWPLFLGWGELLCARPALRAPVIALCAAHQGLLLFCFTHFLRFT